MYNDLKKYLTAAQASVHGLTTEEAKRQLAYHIERVRDFQHERQVHLFVTLFFAGLVIVSMVAFFLVGFSNSNMLVTMLLDAMVALLLVTELCYVSYYYLLENGVQKLYGVTDQLRRKAGLK